MTTSPHAMEARSLFATRDTENFYYYRLSTLARYNNIDRSSTECSNHSMEASPLLVEEERACFLTRFLCWTHGIGIAITPLFLHIGRRSAQIAFQDCHNSFFWHRYLVTTPLFPSLIPWEAIDSTRYTVTFFASRIQRASTFLEDLGGSSNILLSLNPTILRPSPISTHALS